MTLRIVCCDCDGRGRYPSEEQCLSCKGTGRVPDGEGTPITLEEAIVDHRLACVALTVRATDPLADGEAIRRELLEADDTLKRIVEALHGKESPPKPTDRAVWEVWSRNYKSRTTPTFSASVAKTIHDFDGRITAADITRSLDWVRGEICRTATRTATPCPQSAEVGPLTSG